MEQATIEYNRTNVGRPKMFEHRRQISCVIDAEVYDRLRRKATAERPLSTLIREALRKYVGLR